MVGPEDNFMMRGVIPRSIAQVFSEIDKRDEESSTVVKYVFLDKR